MGSKVAAVRTKSFVKQNPECRDQLEELGVELDGKAGEKMRETLLEFIFPPF